MHSLLELSWHTEVSGEKVKPWAFLPTPWGPAISGASLCRGSRGRPLGLEPEGFNEALHSPLTCLAILTITQTSHISAFSSVGEGEGVFLSQGCWEDEKHDHIDELVGHCPAGDGPLTWDLCPFLVWGNGPHTKSLGTIWEAKIKQN